MYLRCILYLLLSVTLPLATSSGQSWVDSALTRLDVQYTHTQQHKTVETLVALDSSLTAFVAAVRKAFPLHAPDAYNPGRYEYLGLYLGHYSDQVGYTGQFLVGAHALNSNSPLRRYTLYSTIMGVQGFAELAGMPNLDSAFTYLKEFPRGPYAKDVYALLGDFYKDLYMLLRDYKEDLALEKEQGNYKYDCFKPYVEESSPIESQRDRAQKLSIQYYDESLKLDPANEWVRTFQRQVRDGTVTGWSYCHD